MEAERVELIRSISSDNFAAYYRQRNKRKEAVYKDVTVFVSKGRNFTVHTFRKKSGEKVSILRIKSDLLNDVENRSLVPDFLDVGEDVSENPEYFTTNLA